MSTVTVIIAIIAALSAYSLISKFTAALVAEATRSNAAFDGFVMGGIVVAVLGIALVNLLYAPAPTSVYQALLGLPFAAVNG